MNTKKHGVSPQLNIQLLRLITFSSLVGLAACSGKSTPSISPPPSLPTATPITKPMADYVSATGLIKSRYTSQIGKTLLTLKVPSTKITEATCNASCDAFVVRQPILTFHWENNQAYKTDTLRVDISGTAAGFKEGNYSTIKYNDIEAVPTLMQTSINPLSADRGQVLLNQVVNNNIVQRPALLPVFASPNIMLNAFDGLTPEQKNVVMEDQRLGSTNQINMLGRSELQWRGKAQQGFAMSGLQPGLTYRFRVVEEGSDGGKVISEKICRIPVCPADYKQ